MLPAKHRLLAPAEIGNQAVYSKWDLPVAALLGVGNQVLAALLAIPDSSLMPCAVVSGFLMAAGVIITDILYSRAEVERTFHRCVGLAASCLLTGFIMAASRATDNLRLLLIYPIFLSMALIASLMGILVLMGWGKQCQEDDGDSCIPAPGPNWCLRFLGWEDCLVKEPSVAAGTV